MKKVKLVFPEHENPVVQAAMGQCSDRVESLKAGDLVEACELVNRGEAEGLVAGIDYTSREVILACRDGIGIEKKTFSACFVMTKGKKAVILADAAACKNPNEEQLFEIVCQTYETALATLEDEPKIAMLSFSTLGSGGKDASIDKIKAVLAQLHAEKPHIKVDGEMQLDAAANEQIGRKKAPNSAVAGQANVLICPDLNSGNILYKALEQFGGWTAAGPILQGFKQPCSDLSRGSTVEDVVAVILNLEKIIRSKKE